VDVDQQLGVPMLLGIGPLIGAGQGEPSLVIAGGQQGGHGTVLNVDVGEATVARVTPAGMDRLHQSPPEFPLGHLCLVTR
jgi:hypothetical protein